MLYSGETRTIVVSGAGTLAAGARLDLHCRASSDTGVDYAYADEQILTTSIAAVRRGDGT